VNKKVDGRRKRKPEKKHEGESRYPKEYKWEGQGAKREKKKGAIGGIIIGANSALKKSDKKRENKKDAWKEKFILAINGGN
jgi:hypothetical protein